MRKQLLTLLLLNCCYSGFAQISASASATVEIMTPATFQKAQDLGFNSISASSSHGTLKVSASGKWSKTKGIKLSGSAPSVQPATFYLSGEINTIYDVTIASYKKNVSETGALMINNFTTHYSLDANGTKVLNVGASLKLDGYVAPGNYSTSLLNVTVNYN